MKICGEPRRTPPKNTTRVEFCSIILRGPNWWIQNNPKRPPVLSFVQYIICHLWIPGSSRTCSRRSYCSMLGRDRSRASGRWSQQIHLATLPVNFPGKQLGPNCQRGSNIPDIGHNTNHFDSLIPRVCSGNYSFWPPTLLFATQKWLENSMFTNGFPIYITALIYPLAIKHGNGTSPI